MTRMTMTGRFPIEDVTPTVACGEHPAKAVVGELVPVSGGLLPRGPRRARRATSSGGARTGEPGRSPGCARRARHRPLARDDPAGRRRPVDASPSRRSRDPYLTWRNAVTKKIEAGQGAKDLANDLAEGAESSTGRPRSCRPTGPGTCRRRGGACATPALPLARAGRPGAGPGRRCSGSTRCGSWSRPVRPVPIWVDRKRALFSAWYEFFPRSEGAVVDRPGGPVQHGTFATAAAAAARRREDGLRRGLPAADPPDRPGQPQGPQQRAGRPAGGRRLAVGDRRGRGRPRRDPPAAGHRWRTSARFVDQAARARPGGRDGPGAAVRARPPVGHRAPGVVHHPAPTARSRTPRTRRRSTRTSTR